MKKITLSFVIILSAIANAFAATGTWTSNAIGKSITYKTSEASKPAKDASGKYMTVVYLENLSCEKIGQNSNSEDVAWLLDKGYRVIELDYAHDAKAVSPYLNLDIQAINYALYKGTSIFGYTNISQDRMYVLFEGYRIQRDVSYYLDDPTVYNYPDAYSTMKGDSLYLDVVYPANPSKAVPTVLTFSYSNSYPGTANEGYTTKYQHKRMFNGYHWGQFNDSFCEGAPAVGCAWAVADHPKYCDWGRGNRKGGAQKEFGAIEINPDAARKVRAAIRTVRGFGKQVGLGNDIALYGFSRGSTAASLAIGDNPFEEWTQTDRSVTAYANESSDIQVAFLGPGIFDYSKMTPTKNEYVHMNVLANSTSDPKSAWMQQGGATAIKNTAVPCFLFYNPNGKTGVADDAEYKIQMDYLMGLLDNKRVTYETLFDYGNGHSVPQTTEDLTKMYRFLESYVAPAKSVGKGDANCDGLISVADLTIIASYILGFDVKINLDNADVTNDKNISVADLSTLATIILG